jgi:F0F1-type ATP synthase membrane subunit b/b'
MVVNFVILFGAVYFFAHKKIKKSFTDRTEKIASDLKAADAARLQAVEITKELSEEEKENDEERKKILKEGEALAKSNSISSLENASDAAKQIETTEISSERQLREDMFTLLGDETYDGIAKNAEKVFRKGLLNNDMSGLVRNSIDELTVKPSDSDMRHLKKLEKVGVVIRSAFPVEENSITRIKSSVIDGLIEYNNEIDDSLENEIVISLGDKEFRGDLEDVLRQIISCVDKTS